MLMHWIATSLCIMHTGACSQLLGRLLSICIAMRLTNEPLHRQNGSLDANALTGLMCLLQIACVNSFLAMPSKGKSDQGTMQVWLQVTRQPPNCRRTVTLQTRSEAFAAAMPRCRPSYAVPGDEKPTSAAAILVTPSKLHCLAAVFSGVCLE